MTRRAGWLVLALLLGFAGPAAGQVGGFGQNKVQYRHFNWQVLKGPHVDLYFYPEEQELAAAALTYAEASYDTLSVLFAHEVPSRIPLIIYASHTDFEQTNILPFIPPEGLLGATDFLKRRVTLPFRGNYAEFRHTMRHEMVHVFQLSYSTENYYRNARSERFAIPLWWSEGLAELWSGGQDARDEMILRDLTISGRLPTLMQMETVTGGIVYPIGGRIHRWLADTYGDWRVARFYQEYWRFDSFDAAIQAVYGRSIIQLNDEFQQAMRREYYPAALALESPRVAGREVARAAIKPAWGPATDSTPSLYYLSGERGYVTIHRSSPDGNGGHDVIVAGRSAEYESLHPFDSRIDPSLPGYLLFSSKSGERDAIFIWDLKQHKAVGRYQFPGIVSILSPVWADGGHSIIFSGLATNGISDLYRIRLPTGRPEKLTDDIYQDLDPTVSPDSRLVAFASDRTAGGLQGAVNLFLLDLTTGSIRQLTAGPWVDETPRWEDNGRIYYASDRDSVLNIFSVDTLGRGRRETSVWTGVFDPDYLPARHQLAAGAFHDLHWGVYLYAPDSAARTDTFSLGPHAPPGAWRWPATQSSETLARSREPYRRHLTVDLATGEALLIPGVGGAQGAQLYLSDLLGDQLLFLGLGTYQGQGLGSLFDNINASAIYLNQTRRLNWGAGLYRFKGYAYSSPYVISYEETSVGGLALLQYPIDRYNRIEAEGILEHSDRVDFDFPNGAPVPSGDLERKGWIASHFVSYVHDNSLWLPSGPIDGGRLRLTTGLSSDFTNSRFDSYLFNADWRHYFRLGNRSAYAVRAFGWYSGGARPRRVNLGGSLALRGYPIYGNILGSRAFMLNQELRFPLLDYFTFGTPLGAVPFPGVDAALFFDLGKAWYLEPQARALLGSYGVSFRWALAPPLVLRLDWGRRFSDNDFAGYGLRNDQMRPGFLQVFFGYNY